MSSSNGGKGGSGNKKKHNKNKNKGKSSFSRITSEQKARLEIFFERFPHPNKTQQDQLAKFLELQEEQVEKWFTERRTQAQVSQPQPVFPTLDTSRDLQRYDEVPNSSRSPTPSVVSDDEADFLMEKSRMLQIAKGAHQELCKLFQANDESVWVKSSHDGRLVLDHKKYQTMFPRDTDPNVFKTPYTCEESSKASMIVDMAAMELVDALLDPKEMTEFFPTMIQRAEIIKEYEHGADGTKHGALLLMYLEIHHLSHLVSPRKYFLLRYCEKVHESGIWVISDVSLDSFGTNLPHLPCWKLPSGCLIHQLPTHNRRNAMVKWIEHVEVNDRPQTSLLYGDLVANNIPYSADKWIMVLQRNAEKLYYAKTSPNEAIEVIKVEGRRSLLYISHRMLQSFCEILNMSCKPEITHYFYKSRNSNNNDFEIKYSVRKNSAPDHPTGMIASLVTSFWIPLNYHHVFHFLKDATKRNQWDHLCMGHSAYEVALVGTGRYIGNRLSIIRRDSPYFLDLKEPFDPRDTEMLILQESSIDNVAAYIVYAPIERKNMYTLMAGRDDSVSSQLGILPSGFVLTRDANSLTDLFNRVMPNQQRGTLLTMAYQIRVSTTPSTKDLKMKDLEIANNIFRTMVNNIKVALGCSGMN